MCETSRNQSFNGVNQHIQVNDLPKSLVNNSVLLLFESQTFFTASPPRFPTLPITLM